MMTNCARLTATYEHISELHLNAPVNDGSNMCAELHWTALAYLRRELLIQFSTRSS